jgi:hypothetical protein
MPGSVAAQAPAGNDFEGPEVSFRDAGGDATYRIEKHVRDSQQPHSGRWCERMTVRGNNGTYVHVSHSIAAARVIGELVPSIWLKADRPGVQLLARVTLPRTFDPKTGKPMTTLVRGSAYSRVGAWEQLRLEDFPQVLERHVRVLRAEFGSGVDGREAFVDQILLNVYGGPGVTNVWIDDLDVAGVVLAQATAEQPAAATPAGPYLSPPSSAGAWPSGAAAPKVERAGSVLLIDGKPFFPRIVEYQGEPPVRLKALGFNAVWVGRAPTAELLRDAAAAGLWVIAPAPPPAALESRNADGSQLIGRQFDPVLAWDLGRGLAKSQLESTRRWAKLLQAADPRGRLMVCEPESELKDYTRPPIRLLLTRRDVLGTSLELNQYSAWLRERTQLALPGTILWTTIQTQPSSALVEQMALLGFAGAPQISLQDSQIRTLVFAALAGGARGLLFQSRSRLDANDSQTRRRAAILELVNMELDLIERWPATGSFTMTGDSSDPHAKGAVIETDRSRLLMPMFTPPGSQLVMGATAGSVVNYTVPGVPEEHNAFELSLVSFRPLESKRVAGGTRVLLGELERDSLVVFSQDQRIIRGLHTRLKDTQRRAAELSRQLAAEEQVEVEVVGQRLSASGRTLAATRPLRIAAQNDLREFDALAAKGDLPAAYYRARHALAAARLIERAHFEDVTTGEKWPLADPFAANFGTLDRHVRFVAEMASAPRGPNILTEGACENLDRMIAAGWKHYRHPQDNITSAVDLSPQTAHSGQGGLRLRAVATDSSHAPSAVESPPMWVTTAAVPVERGQLLEIQGWVRVTRPITGSVDGLLIIDSLTGEALAHRVTQPGEWQSFSVYRAVGRTGTMNVTFALSGLGEAWVDDVSIRPVSRGAAGAPAQQAQQTRQPPVLGRAGG